ncbi:ABC transporter B family member 6, partial [Bienertia sinuspersici]
MAKTRRQKNHKEPYTGEDGQSTLNNWKGNDNNPKPSANTVNNNRKGEGDDTNRDNDVEKPQQGESQIHEHDKTNLNSWIEVMTGKGLTKQDHDITNRTETPMVTIDMDDIEDEITYWSSAMICFVLGANPPLPVMSGFCNRIWVKKGLDKVSMVGRGLTNRGSAIFDYKPLIIKQWSPDIELHKENVKTVPIWIRMPNLDLKYWGQGCLHKLGDIIGTTLKVDNVTMNKDRLSYARILVEVELDKELPDYIRFQNEKGLPKYGHPSDKCHKQTKKQWQPKLAQDQQQPRVGPSCTKTADTEQKAEEEGQKDSQGFLSAQRKRIKPADQAAPVTPIHNSFEALSSDSEEDEDEVDNLAAGEQP